MWVYYSFAQMLSVGQAPEVWKYLDNWCILFGLSLWCSTYPQAKGLMKKRKEQKEEKTGPEEGIVGLVTKGCCTILRVYKNYQLHSQANPPENN